MDGNFDIEVDVAARLVKIRIGGLFGLDDVRNFAAAQRRAYSRLGEAKGRHRTLCDVSECKIQLQQAVEAFRGLLNDPTLMSERMAFVTGKSPAKMQIRRLISRETCQFFENTSDAECWLLAGPAPANPAATRPAA